MSFSLAPETAFFNHLSEVTDGEKFNILTTSDPLLVGMHQFYLEVKFQQITEFPCANTDFDGVDTYGDGCSYYTGAPTECDVIGYKDADFDSDELCCACVPDGGDDTITYYPYVISPPLEDHRTLMTRLDFEVNILLNGACAEAPVVITTTISPVFYTLRDAA